MTAEERSYLIVWDRDGGSARVMLEDADRVDAAVTLWVDSGRTRDTLIYLTTIGGATYRILASEITSWVDCTPESRAREAEIERAMKAEAKAAEWSEDD